MTIERQAKIETAKFVVGTTVAGGLAALAFTYYPSETGTVMALTVFLYTVKFYYDITRDRLQRERERIESALRQQR